MKVGYARTSTAEQVAGFEAQQRDLEAAGCEQIYAEQVSSVGKREQLEEALRFVRRGDTLVVTKLDRLARSVADLVSITAALERKGVSLTVLEPALDTSSPAGKLMLNLLGSIAQFERELMLERQREGIAKAKSEGKYKGRRPTIDNDTIRSMKESGHSVASIAATLRISRMSVYRAL